MQSENQIFVQGLPSSANEDDIAQFFGSIGVIKVDKKTRTQKIWVYKDRATGISKGECTITYEDPQVTLILDFLPDLFSSGFIIYLRKNI